VFVEYPDASFMEPRRKPAWMGLLGPTIRAEVYDTVVITFKNLASRPYNLHAVGVSYWKVSEGAGYEDETSQLEKEGDRVDPGKTHTYIWEIQQNQGPTDGDSPCLTHSYSSNTDSVKDTNSGLIGALLVCRPGKGQVNWLHSPVSAGKSWYSEPSSSGATRPLARNRTELHTINGYINGSLPGLTLCLKKQVYWHVIGLGTGPEVHSIFLEGHSFLVRNHRLSSLEISPATYLTAQTMPGTTGWFRMFCQIPSHQQGNFILQDIGKGNDPVTWTHYIAAEEMDWDYAPVKNTTSLFLEAGPQRIGSKYKKVMFVEYEDATFKRKMSAQSDKGILGPVLKGEVGDQLKIVFKNLASRPYNIYPHGLTHVGPYHAMRPSEARDVKDIPVPPGQSFTYSWRVTTEDGPTNADPRCLTRFYYSSINPTRDTASGLIGPLLICFKKSMDQRGNQVDETRLVLFSVFDENRSWYLSENIQRFCTDPAHVDTQDPQFYASNVMHSESINGFVFDNLQLNLCLNEVVYWYVLSVGAQTDFLSVFFTGNTFKRNMVFEDVLTLFPFSGETVFMTALDRRVQTLYKGTWLHPGVPAQSCHAVLPRLEHLHLHHLPHPRREPLRGRRKPFRQYRKVVFREYLDNSFTQPLMRGELDEHLGILGPYIRLLLGLPTLLHLHFPLAQVTFKNLASRPFSFHSTLQAYEETQGGVQGQEAVQPGELRQYSWKVLPQMAPTTQEFDCKAWAYFSNMDLEKDLHSGLIGPLIICRRGVLNFLFRRQLAVQEFSLLFTIFDETKSWYFQENMERNCRPPCRVQQDNVDFRRNHSFHAINGYVRDSLPGLVMAQQQRVRWHLLNMGSTEDIHSVHFHGQLFSIRTNQEYRMGVYNLYPGVFGTVEMWPTHAGIWRVECKVGEHQQAGMSALFLVYNPSE
uniref:Coagulation factor VIII n=1 Tax=Nothoprocta perdicaria TaxID=30464 RepID=A0A8C6YN31_NOTPE